MEIEPNPRHFPDLPSVDQTKLPPLTKTLSEDGSKWEVDEGFDEEAEYGEKDEAYEM